MSKIVENVLILQGGGSLGAFGCGVYKSLAESNVNIDIIAGTSIGGVNAAIIAGFNEQLYDNAARALEEFWLETAEKFPVYPFDPYWKVFTDINKNYNFQTPMPVPRKIIDDALTMTDLSSKAMQSFFSSLFYGNRKLFLPRWNPSYLIQDPEYFFLIDGRTCMITDHSQKRWTNI